MFVNKTYPWGAFNSFLQSIEIYKTNLPNVIKAEQLPFKGSYADHIIQIFLFFEFVDRNHVPTDLFKEFLSQESKWPEIFEGLIREAYRQIIFDKISSTEEITDEFLSEAFKKCSPSVYTRRKMATFFKNAAAYSDIHINAKLRTRTSNIVVEKEEKKTKNQSTSLYLSPALPKRAEKDDLSGIPAIILSLVKTLPPEGTKIGKAKRENLQKIFETAMALYYPDEDSQIL